jgi:hypothetical protein
MGQGCDHTLRNGRKSHEGPPSGGPFLLLKRPDVTEAISVAGQRPHNDLAILAKDEE